MGFWIELDFFCIGLDVWIELEFFGLAWIFWIDLDFWIGLDISEKLELEFYFLDWIGFFKDWKGLLAGIGCFGLDGIFNLIVISFLAWLGLD